jgi:hypothetical protein
VSVYSTTLRQLEVYTDDGRLNEGNEYLGELALNLASQLDSGAGMAHAAIANQYRAAMDAIRKADSTNDGDDEFDKFLSGLGTPTSGSTALGNQA